MLRAHVETTVSFAGSDTEQRRANVPLDALQQIVRNAVMHRTYQATNAPVRVTWFDDRIEVQSPGGPYGVVDAATFGQPGMTDYRNPNLAGVLGQVGFVERFGVGLPTAQALLRQNGNPPLGTGGHCDLRQRHHPVTGMTPGELARRILHAVGRGALVPGVS